MPASRMAMNEDAFVANDTLGLYLVCDGAGAGPAGEVASAVAAEAITQHVRRSVHDRGRQFRSHAFSVASAVEAVERGFDAVFREARARPDLEGMTTTLTMVLVNAEQAVVGHIGDSRLYLARDEQLDQMTIDHHTTDPVDRDEAPLVFCGPVQAYALGLQADDVLILTTDGLNEVFADPRWVLGQIRTGSVSRITARLLARAAELGGAGDATAVVIRVEDDSPQTRIMHSMPSHVTLFQNLGFALAP